MGLQFIKNRRLIVQERDPQPLLPRKFTSSRHVTCSQNQRLERWFLDSHHLKSKKAWPIYKVSCLRSCARSNFLDSNSNFLIWSHAPTSFFMTKIPIFSFAVMRQLLFSWLKSQFIRLQSYTSFFFNDLRSSSLDWSHVPASLFITYVHILKIVV